PVKPEFTADGPKDPLKPPAANIPGPGGSGAPAGPALPALPPWPSAPGGDKKPVGTSTGRGANKFTLLDTLERPWDSDTIPPGSLVLVEFMTSTCPHCPKVIPGLKELQSRYGASGLQVMGVLCDDLPQKERAQAAAKYGRDYNLNYAVYVEPVEAGAVRDKLGVERYPWAVLVGSRGQVLWHGHAGDRAKLEAAVKQGLGK
ncbi:MAG: TlpA family protein disulfide reductase, partial [Gemmata sp.]